MPKDSVANQDREDSVLEPCVGKPGWKGTLTDPMRKRRPIQLKLAEMRTLLMRAFFVRHDQAVTTTRGEEQDTR